MTDPYETMEMRSEIQRHHDLITKLRDLLQKGIVYAEASDNWKLELWADEAQQVINREVG